MNSEYRPPLLVACASLAVVALFGWLLTGSVVAGGAVLLILIGLAAVSPVGALGAVVVALPYFYLPIGFGRLEFAASEVILLTSAAGTALRIAISAAPSDDRVGALAAIVSPLIRNRLVQFLTVVAIAGAVGVALAFDQGALGASLREWRWSLAEPLLFVSLLVVAARGTPARRFMAASLIAAGVVAALHGLVDVAGGGGVAADSVRRLSGPLPHPNALALFILRPFVLGLTLFVLFRRSRRALVVPIVLTGLVLLGTFSRGAILAVAFAVAIIALDVPRRMRWVAGSMAVGIIGLAIAVAPDRMTNLFEGGSVSLRIDIWSSAAAMIRDNPITGYGPDQFFYAYAPRYIQPTAWDERFTSHAHNLLADSWIRLGIIGAVAAVFALAAVARRLLADRASTTPGSRLGTAATVALAATLVHGLIDNAYFGHDLAMSAWLLAWLAFEPHGRSSGDARQRG